MTASPLPESSRRTSRLRTFLPLLCIFVFQAGFGLYYVVSEHQRGHYFDPMQSGKSYFERQVLEVWNNPRAWGDLEAYNRAAYSIVTENRIVNSDGKPSAWVTPGYPLVLAMLYTLFGFRFFPILIFNALCVTFSYHLLRKVAERAFSPATGIATLVLLAINLRVSMFVGYIYTECLFILMVSAGIAWTLKIARHARIRKSSYLGLGLVCGFGILVKPAFLALVPVFGTYLFYEAWRSQKNRIPAIALALSIYLLGSFGFLAAWVARNHHAIGEPLISTSGFYALAEGNQDFYRSFRFVDTYRNAATQNPYGPLIVSNSTGNQEVDEAFALGAQFQRWKAENRGFYLWLCAWRFKTFWMPYTADMSPRNRAVSLVIWLLIFPVAFVGAYRQRRNSIVWLLLGGAVALLALPSLVVVGPSLRYQVPAQILLTLLAASEFARIAVRFRLK
jgi:4-amino-4-deoxy-L-arabinose transferase-like glycosyltransferase